ncbi:hypothetical protein OS493_021475 [Desmophyllum pertusum]|uniref:Uncharacterized protein n=1 Tax=Desmophyllum pertusum TaxID=174260 RepID=A0A9W9YYW3_9CNID|nr:hypothetical protein OS493_021475 [Desmophyllum pertusum]
MEYAIVNFYSCKVQYNRERKKKKAEQEILEQESEKEDKFTSPCLNGSLKKNDSNGSYRLAVVMKEMTWMKVIPNLQRKHHHYFWDPYETAFMDVQSLRL